MINVHKFSHLSLPFSLWVCRPWLVINVFMVLDLYLGTLPCKYGQILTFIINDRFHQRQLTAKYLSLSFEQPKSEKVLDFPNTKLLFSLQVVYLRVASFSVVLETSLLWKYWSILIAYHYILIQIIK